ncbi:TetR/AcrR family transcriptional regulator [Nocardia altamirensis]|uniref:TetR/AcrR family transcriptional regulator n=1 Tax=Nocardia altamirensis TaxID=472158 RepID=UPI000B16D692|nr:TetR/AcrR family transcriptional regulator [Nocardia altamirensis]
MAAKKGTQNASGEKAADAGKARFLSRDVLLNAAMELVERKGPDKLTIRALGADLGVDHTAIYRHFRSMDELLLALADQLLAQAVADIEPSPDWRATLRRLALGVRRAYLTHPRLAPLAAARVTRGEAEFRIVDLGLGALKAAGMDDRTAARSYLGFAHLVLGSTALEAITQGLDERARAGDLAATTREYLAATPADYPHLAAALPHFAEAIHDDRFELGLELLLDSVALQAAKFRSNS